MNLLLDLVYERSDSFDIKGLVYVQDRQIAFPEGLDERSLTSNVCFGLLSSPPNSVVVREFSDNPSLSSVNKMNGFKRYEEVFVRGDHAFEFLNSGLWKSDIYLFNQTTTTISKHHDRTFDQQMKVISSLDQNVKFELRENFNALGEIFHQGVNGQCFSLAEKLNFYDSTYSQTGRVVGGLSCEPGDNISVYTTGLTVPRGTLLNADLLSDLYEDIELISKTRNLSIKFMVAESSSPSFIKYLGAHWAGHDGFELLIPQIHLGYSPLGSSLSLLSMCRAGSVGETFGLINCTHEGNIDIAFFTKNN